MTLGVGVFHAAQVAAEAILVELFVRLAVPQAAGVGADLVGQNDLCRQTVLPNSSLKSTSVTPQLSSKMP